MSEFTPPLSLLFSRDKLTNIVGHQNCTWVYFRRKVFYYWKSWGNNYVNDDNDNVKILTFFCAR